MTTRLLPSLHFLIPRKQSWTICVSTAVDRGTGAFRLVPRLAITTVVRMSILAGKIEQIWLPW